MSLSRREMVLSLAAGLVAPRTPTLPLAAAPTRIDRPLRRVDARGEERVDWDAVRALFPLTPEWTHLASFLFASHPRPVSEAIDRFRRKLDADPTWVDDVALDETEGQPLRVTKRALAAYVGGKPEEIALTSNTTGALAMAYHGLRVRRDQEVLTTEHDHYSHHESIRYAAVRSGCGVRYVALYDRPAAADASQMVDRIARAIRPSTRAVGVTWVHSSTGVKIPVDGIAAAVARANRGRAAADRCLLIVDGVHGFANQDVDVARLGADFFAAGTHKWLFGPRGTGFLWGHADVWPHLRPTIPAFEPDAPQTWEAWMHRTPLPTTTAPSVAPGGFVAYEHLLAVPAAVALHREIGRGAIAARIAELNAQFRDGAATIPGLTLHTPRDPTLSGGISAFEVAGLTAKQVTARLAARRFRTSDSPYKVSYARVAAGVMNMSAEIDAVLRAIRALGA